ncbi:uncharacterized protein LOC123879159 isoform X2 [Maniola jurtina]|uniref:uncharacterized protein LOC123879159 isoform X2 n=1 Tax=Maniola jurtina TaxID=191418 RepID=UPI001E6871D8|nr:uncharacterized protein LOC123879159 isoform X2 [Maniola jurtina]
MSAYNSKPELLAIYRLEFYKKMQNWKLSTSRPRHDDMKCSKKKKRVEKKPNHNTHEVEKLEENEASDPLNVAFVQTEPENIPSQPNLPRQCTLALEWQEPINIWPGGAGDAGSTANYDQHQAPTQGCTEPTAMGREQELLHDLVLGQNTRNVVEEANHKGSEDGGCTGFVADAEAPMQCPSTNELWSEEAEARPSEAMAGYCPEERMDCPLEGAPKPCASLKILGATPSLRSGVTLKSLVTLGIYPGFLNVRDTSLDSLSDFYRGAHVAPHSSETDLSAPPSLQAPPPSVASLSRMSTQQLKNTLEHSSKTLKILESECEWRQLRERANYAMDDLDELPTRDLGPSPPPLPIRDRILAGSHTAWGVVEPHEVWEAGDSQLVRESQSVRSEGETRQARWVEEPQPARVVRKPPLTRSEGETQQAQEEEDLHSVLAVEPRRGRGAAVSCPTWSVAEIHQARGVVEPQLALEVKKRRPYWSEGETRQGCGVEQPKPAQGHREPQSREGKTHQLRGVGVQYPTWSEGETQGLRVPCSALSEGETHQVQELGVQYPAWSEGETQGLRVPCSALSEGETHQVQELGVQYPAWSEGETHQVRRVGEQYPAWSEGKPQQVRRVEEWYPAWREEVTQQARSVGEQYPAWSEGKPQQARRVGEQYPAWREGETQQARRVGEHYPACSEGKPQQARSVGEQYLAWSEGKPQQARRVGEQYPAWREGETQQARRVEGQYPARSEGKPQQARRVGEQYPTWSEGETHQAHGVGATYPAWSEGETHQVRRVGVQYSAWSEEETHQARGLFESQPALVVRARTYWRSERERHQVPGKLRQDCMDGGPQPAWRVSEMQSVRVMVKQHVKCEIDWRLGKFVPMGAGVRQGVAGVPPQPRGRGRGRLLRSGVLE